MDNAITWFEIPPPTSPAHRLFTKPCWAEACDAR